MQNIIKISIFIIIIFIVGVFFVGLNKDTNYNTNFLTGKKISNISLEYFDENKFYKEDDLKKNNYTLINFWASWCSPCRQEHPLLIKLSKEKNLKLLGVNFKDKKKQAEMMCEALKKNDLVIYESTVYPKCTEEVCIPILEKESGLVLNEDFYVGYSPERVVPGDKTRTIDKIMKIVNTKIDFVFFGNFLFSLIGLTLFA